MTDCECFDSLPPSLIIKRLRGIYGREYLQIIEICQITEIKKIIDSVRSEILDYLISGRLPKLSEICRKYSPYYSLCKDVYCETIMPLILSGKIYRYNVNAQYVYLLSEYICNESKKGKIKKIIEVIEDIIDKLRNGEPVNRSEYRHIVDRRFGLYETIELAEKIFRNSEICYEDFVYGRNSDFKKLVVDVVAKHFGYAFDKNKKCWTKNDR